MESTGTANVLRSLRYAKPKKDKRERGFYISDITTIWKVTKNFTSITDLNLLYDSVSNGKWGGGVAQYFTYAINDWLQLGVRGEIWRDSGAFYVAQFRANNDVIHFFARAITLAPAFPAIPATSAVGIRPTSRLPGV
jgi:hypothetical protein